MKVLISLVALIAVGNCATCANRTKLLSKAFDIGLVKGTVCDAVTAEAIMICAEPYILKCPTYMENLTDSLIACVLSKSMKFLGPVMTLKSDTEKCLGSGSNALDFLAKILSIGKPMIQPLYKVMIGEIAKLKTAGKSVDQQSCYMWGYMLAQATQDLGLKYCNSVVGNKNVTAKEWTCSKSCGSRVINFGLYPTCASKVASGK